MKTKFVRHKMLVKPDLEEKRPALHSHWKNPERQAGKLQMPIFKSLYTSGLEWRRFRRYYQWGQYFNLSANST